MVEEKEISKNELEKPAFKLAKIRVEKSKRIADDLKKEVGPITKARRQREEEIRTVEIQSKQGEEGKVSGYEELVVDSRDYQLVRYSTTYQLERGDETIEEELVSFAKLGETGQLEWLMVDKDVIALNAGLYDRKLVSQLHAQGIDYNSYTIPRVDGRGAYTGVVTLFESKQG